MNTLSLEISKECSRGIIQNNTIRIVGSVVTAEVVQKVLNKSLSNEFDYKEDIIGVYDAFDTPLIHYEKSSRQYFL